MIETFFAVLIICATLWFVIFLFSIHPIVGIVGIAALWAIIAKVCGDKV